MVSKGALRSDRTAPTTVDLMQTRKSPTLLIAAVILVIVGAIACLALLIPAVRESNTIIMTTTYVLAMCAPVGLVLAIVFALLSGRRSR
mgnify:FL=1